MKLTSPAFEHNQMIPRKYTCQGEDINPPLAITGIPEGTQSLALIMDDPDAPMGTWVHWTVWNITPHIKEIQENMIPNLAPWDPASPATPLPAMEGITSFGKTGYGGPCPPSGTHRYFFKLYALDAQLSFKGTPSKQALEQAMRGHILEKTELVGLYKKQ
ncbi:MAG: YbhB/YbcL family Raf kinase inhibitor-like protein [Candidatus Omnitrophica bacterium]|nr:YbhB/YbcL family Raf kinase inhibitor-like protein [Candidatus Omnitrophota bacterium]